MFVLLYQVYFTQHNVLGGHLCAYVKLPFLCEYLSDILLYFTHPFTCYEVDSHCGVGSISLRISDVEHLSLCLLAIYISALERCSLVFLIHLLTGLFAFRC